MAWNEPGNNGGRDDKDPWGNKNHGGREQGPPDLDEVFSKLSRKVGGVFGSKKGPTGSGSAVGLGAVAVLAVAVWGFSGFYTVSEAEQGVVLRFGKFDQIVKPGLNWKPTFIDEVIPVNVQAIRSLRASGLMLTKDENVLKVEMDVQYRVDNAEKYLFSVTNADDSLRQATDSALRAVIGDSTMDQALTTGRQTIRANTQAAINKIIAKYDMGIRVVDVNFQSARPPEAVKDAFDDAIAAREDEERYVREAEAYSNDILPKATGRAERLKNEAEGYSERVINGALGDVAQFDKLLPQYEAAKKVTRERMYLDTMERVYSNTSKVLIDTKSGGNNVMYLPLEKLMNQSNNQAKKPADSSRLSGIELEKVETPTPVAPTPRADTGRQGRY
ncbi:MULTISPECIES: FtsH protease activity modulator HflK [Photobacterium]|uniref:Protein HflK n=1 Tax=Photobacterium piscicola TaxID=1378299 RepID=A0A1T5I3P8_9GAMM|nr:MULTISPECIES: FtsH protease activity modulator HflK [Photobacterium]MEC6825105.1 FtsH protease activity modulator HflK [Photobacterium piscicola]MEC6884119.1 FtsH protease activity modulator HflK [Photobacterium piscicola]MEC6900479.1 FtsH protease activity modulator HflK [Photobacterium piscicola]MEC6909572.1 FtsH protease activity modulator HflK [Photobacterium piscicola]PST85755.1 FtsH protease activity modulator HflK [Photobacterium sp. NCIMB 13483]